LRIWDIPAGYLNRGSLLGEHRECHGIINILRWNKQGYSRHPETRRWRGRLGALRRRHAVLVAEMRLRGYQHHSPAAHRGRPGEWPETFVDPPAAQYRILGLKYRSKDPGRIPLPRSAGALWAAHKYSVLARDQDVCREIGRRVARLGPYSSFEGLAAELVVLTRQAPSPGNLRNALDHMWGYVSDDARRLPVSSVDPGDLLARIAEETRRRSEPYLLGSVALSELGAWI